MTTPGTAPQTNRRKRLEALVNVSAAEATEAHKRSIDTRMGGGTEAETACSHWDNVGGAELPTGHATGGQPPVRATQTARS